MNTEPHHITARILVLEDDVMTRSLLVRNLSRAGYQVRSAEEGHEALEHLQRSDQFALVVADLDMPGLNGIDFLKRAIYIHPNLAVVIASGMVTAEAEKQLAAMGVTHLLRKPYSRDALFTEVVKCLSKHHYDNEAIEMLSNALPDALAGLDVEVVTEVHPPFLRASPHMLGRLSALVDISGPNLRGRLIISGPLVTARLVREWQGQSEDNRDGLWDAIGELANRVGGKVVAHYRGRGFDLNMSAPLIVEGDRVWVRFRTRMPSLVVPVSLEEDPDPVYAEWTLAEKGADGPGPQQPEISSGGLDLL